MDSGNNRPQIRTSQDDAAAVGYGFHPQQENLSEFPAAFVPKRWTGTDDLVEVSALIFSLHVDFFDHFPGRCMSNTLSPHTNNTFLILLHIIFRIPIYSHSRLCEIPTILFSFHFIHIITSKVSR